MVTLFKSLHRNTVSVSAARCYVPALTLVSGQNNLHSSYHGYRYDPSQQSPHRSTRYHHSIKTHGCWTAVVVEEQQVIVFSIGDIFVAGSTLVCTIPASLYSLSLSFSARCNHKGLKLGTVVLLDI